MIAQLEAALADEFSLDNLQVYGDALQAAGDPRGQLIAIDLHAARHGMSSELAYRRRQALRAWLELPKSVDPTQGPWKSVRFAFGFVEQLRADLALEVLRSPAGPYVRGLHVTGRIPRMVAVLHELGAAPRPWLERLSIISRATHGAPPGVWRHEPPLLEEAWIAPVIAATPRLRVLQLAGTRMLRGFPHPAVTQLRVDGVDALQTLLEPGPAMPAVAELELAFAPATDRYVQLPWPWPPLLPADSMPALTRLDLSENWRPATTDTQHDVFDVLPTLGVREQLEVLRLWAIPTGHARRFQATALPRLHTLELEHLPAPGELALPHVAITKVALHWPHDPGALTEVWMTVPGNPPRRMPLAGLLRECRFARDVLVPDARAALEELCGTCEALPYGGPGYTISSGLVRRGLDGLYLDASHGELWPWAMLHRELRALRGEHEVWVTLQDP